MPAPDHDDLYASPLGAVPDFSFDAAVVAVFDDMIARSVPGYHSIVAMTGQLAARHAQAGTALIELGCSTGASLLAMRERLVTPGCRLLGIDNSAPMIDACRANLAPSRGAAPVELRCEDIRHSALPPASAVVLNFSLQFIPVADRDALLARCAAALRPGGVLILSEKVRFADRRQQALHTDMHHAFKRCQGYSELEIAQKRSALEQVMQPETLAAHRRRLRAAGFASAEVWFQCFNFLSLVAIR